MDFKGPIANNLYFLLVINEYLRFPELEIVGSMAARQVKFCPDMAYWRKLSQTTDLHLTVRRWKAMQRKEASNTKQ